MALQRLPSKKHSRSDLGRWTQTREAVRGMRRPCRLTACPLTPSRLPGTAGRDRDGGRRPADSRRSCQMRRGYERQRRPPV